MWKNKNHKGEWRGGYEKDKDGERVFILWQTVEGKVLGVRKITFESWQMAVKLGWKKS